MGEVNDSYVKLVKFQGEFVWHHHDAEDELFLIVKGSMRMRLRDRDLMVGPGEFVIIPRGVEHMPVADRGDARAPLRAEDHAEYGQRFERADRAEAGEDLRD